MLRVSVTGDTVENALKDNGMGLYPACLSRLFNRFAQRPLPSAAPTGLGRRLGLARRLAEMHGGALHARSEGLAQRGEFVAHLPDVEPAALPAVAECSARRRTPGTLKALKFLVVDDSMDVPARLGARSGSDGFHGTTDYNDLAAVAATEDAQPDVVTLRIGMPGMHGCAAAGLVCKQPVGQGMLPGTPTGWEQSTDKNRAIEAGFEHHLVKPLDHDMLKTCLQA